MIERDHPSYYYSRGFFALGLMETLEVLPDHLWRPARRKRTYINSVLARAEVSSSYRPARKLWERWENGYYMPARDMHVRRKNADGVDNWVPITEALNLPWVIRGTRAAPGSLLTMTDRTVNRL
jgi:hypothetical protein